MLHVVVSALGIVMVAALAIAGVLGDNGTSALLGSLFGYVLGASSSRSGSASSTSPSAATSTPTVNGLWPVTGAANSTTPVVISGSRLLADQPAPTVTFGDAQPVIGRVINDGTLYVVAPSQAAATVDVIVTLHDGTRLSQNLHFTYL